MVIELIEKQEKGRQGKTRGEGYARRRSYAGLTEDESVEKVADVIHQDSLEVRN